MTVQEESLAKDGIKTKKKGIQSLLYKDSFKMFALASTV